MAAGLLKGKLTEPHDQAIVTIVEKGAQRGASIIRQLLTFSRGLEGARVSVQIRHLVNDMVHVIRQTFPRNIEVDSKAGAHRSLGSQRRRNPTLPSFDESLRQCSRRDAEWGKIGRFRREHSVGKGTGGPRPASKARILCCGHCLRHWKRNPQGDHQPHFEPFFTTKEASRGTGLGLSTVMDIVKHHGGFVTVYSEPAIGTRFKVYLPASEVPQLEATEFTTLAPLGHGELILLVDDEASIREATKQMLEANQYCVLTAANGAEAIRMFVQDRAAVQLVLTDIMMPTMDGVHLIRSIRAFEPSVRIVAMSGLDQGLRAEEFEALGVREYLAKPFEATELLKTVHRALAGSPV